MDKIANLNIEPPLTPDLDEYTQSVADRFIEFSNKKQKSNQE
jgi:hypothetical protein